MHCAAESFEEDARIREYRRIYMRCLRAQWADRWAFRVAVFLFLLVVLRAMLVFSSGAGSVIRERSTLTEARMR